MEVHLARQLIRHKLHEDRLPRSRAVDIWAAPGDGQTCDGCGAPITRNQQIVWGIATQDWTSIHFHEDCFQIWDAERLALSRQEPDGRRGPVISAPDESLLQEKAREAIRRGHPPRTRPDRRLGGPGSGETCPVCGNPVPQNEMEFEVVFNRHGMAPGSERYHLHRRCFAAWEFARTKMEGTG